MKPRRGMYQFREGRSILGAGASNQLGTQVRGMRLDHRVMGFFLLGFL